MSRKNQVFERRLIIEKKLLKRRELLKTRLTEVRKNLSAVNEMLAMLGAR